METNNKEVPTQSWQTTGIGTKEIKKLEPKPCKVLGVGMVALNNKKHPGKMIEKIVFKCEYPGRESPIEFSDCELIQNKEVIIKPTWYFEDEDKNIQQGSTLANVLLFYNAPTLKDMVGKTVQTALDARGYLCLRVY